MSQRSLLIWVCGAAALLAACGSTSVRSATPSPATTDGGGSAPRGTPPAGVPGGTGAEPSPAISATEPPSVATALPSGEACTSNAAPVFTHHYTDLDQIDFINPTIVTSGNWLKNRQYHKVVTDAQNNAPEVPVYAPVDAVATGVTYYLGRMVAWDGTSFDLAQYDLRFRVSCELTYGFDHVSRLAEPFASIAPLEPSRDTRDAELPLSVEVEAGQLIGWTSGAEPAHTWDFIVANTAKINEFSNQARYERSKDLVSLLHAACPADYFEPDLAETYRAKYGNWQGRASGAGCGLSADVPGALAGGWFLTPFDASDPFALTDWGLVATLAADGYLDLNGPGVALRISDADASFLDPAAMTGEHCYLHYQGGQWAYVALLSDTELAAAFGRGPCPASLPAGHQVFHR